MIRIRFFVAGIPKSMSIGSAIAFKRDGVLNRVHKRRNTEWALLIGQVGRQHAPSAPLEGPIGLTLVFYLPRPQSGKKLVAPLKRPDVDNLTHKLSDAFNGVFWRDDSQIVDFLAYKRFAEPAGQPGVEITVEQIIPSQASTSARS